MKQGYYIRRTWKKEPGMFVGKVVRLDPSCTEATLAADHGWVRVPRFVFWALSPLTPTVLKTLKMY